MIDPTGTAETSTGATDADEITADDANPGDDPNSQPAIAGEDELSGPPPGAPADPDLDRAAEPGPPPPTDDEAGPEPATAPAPAAEPAPDAEPPAEPVPPDGDLDRAAEPAPTEPSTAEAVPTTEDVPSAEATDTSEADVTDPGPADDDAAPPAAVGPRTVGRLIADSLRAAGVRYAFTVPGESFLGLLEGLNDAGIRVVTTRHEGGAAYMAEAYGQLTGRPAACVGTRAVGAANLAIGIHTARQNSTPMFVLIGQVQRALQGREAFQEVDQVESFGRLAKWSAEPRTAAEVPGILSQAVEAALGGRPGPVLLSLPEDLQDEVVPADEAPAVARPPLPRADVADVRAVLQLLASAERPVILAGGGVLRARTSSDLTRLAELLHVPVIAGWRRGDVFSNDHPLFLGMAGYGSPRVVRARLEAADALLVVGCRLSEITSFGYTVPREGQRWAHVDLEPHTAGRAAAAGLPAPTIAIRSDARSFLRGAVQRLRGAVLDAGLVETRRINNEADRGAWESAATVDGVDWDGPGVHPGRIITTLRRVLPDEAILTTDAGNFSGWAARGFRFRRPGTFLGPTSGAMGYGLPAGIAAALVHRDRPVVALTGDGGLAMTMAELETAVRENARLVVLAFDNERYGTIRMHQEGRETGDPIATDLGPIDFTAIARACGARGTRVESDDAFEGALRQALAADRPTVIQLTLDRRWLSVDHPAVS